MISKEEYIAFLKGHKELLTKDGPFKLKSGFIFVGYRVARCHGSGQSLSESKADSDAISALVDELLADRIMPKDLQNVLGSRHTIN